MNYIIFGGSGFIGTHLIHLLKNECIKPGDKIYDLDIVMPGEEGVVPGVVEKNEGVEYIRLDVCKPIEFDFVLFFKYRMMDNSFPGTDFFNCTFEPAYNIEQICETMKKATGLKYKIPLIPGGLLMAAATILGPIGGKKVGIHPARVKKLMVSTNICGKKLAVCGYKFHYSFEDTFRDWLNDCDGQGLF